MKSEQIIPPGRREKKLESKRRGNRAFNERRRIIWMKFIWLCSFSFNKKYHFIGYLDSEIDAARAYDEYVKKNNFPLKLNF